MLWKDKKSPKSLLIPSKKGNAKGFDLRNAMKLPGSRSGGIRTLPVSSLPEEKESQPVTLCRHSEKQSLKQQAFSSSFASLDRTHGHKGSH